MSTEAREKRLLDTIFDDATSDNARALAIAALKKATGKDRAGLVEKYYSATSTKGSSSSSGSLEDLARILHLEATIRGLQNQLEDIRKHHTHNLNQAWDTAGREFARVNEFEHLARSLALTMLNAGWVNSKSLRDEIAGKIAKPDPDTNVAWNAPTDKVIEIERRLIDDLKEAVAKANEAEKPATREAINCANCGRPFVPTRSDAKTCSNTCRQSLHRSRNRCNGSSHGSASTAHGVTDSNT